MGYSRFSDSDWKGYTTKTHVGKSTSTIYASRAMDPSLDPKGVGIRESRDSDFNPESNAIILALDVTGSMSMVLDALVRRLGDLMKEIYDRKPVTDPHIMCMGIGDVECDSAPLQVTQFEADIRISKELEKVWLEQGGGGNSYESYTLAWYFAAMNTAIDCFEKRGKKGYLFTVGDEEPTTILRASAIRHFLGTKPQKDLDPNALLTMVSRTYNVFHVMVAEGSHYRACGPRVQEKWTALLGQRALKLTDHTKLPEVVVSAIQMNEGADSDKVIESWDGSTSVVVRDALSGYSLTSPTAGKSGVVRV